MLLESRNFDHAGGAVGGTAATMGEIWEATHGSMRLVENANSRLLALERAYDSRIDAIFEATGQRLNHPMRSDAPVFDEVADALELGPQDDPYERFQRQLESLQEQYPQFAERIRAERPVIEDARALAAASEGRLHEVWARTDGGLKAWTARLAGGVSGMAMDPINVATMAIGPWGQAGLGARGLLWMSAKMGAANAGAETAIQPFVQNWRKEAGLPSGLDIAALNVAAAAAFGFTVDATVRGAVRGGRKLVGRPYKGPTPGRSVFEDSRRFFPIDPKSDPLAALERAARAAPEGSPLRAAADGDPAALRQVAEASGMADDPAVRGGLSALEADEVFRGVRGTDADVSEAEHLTSLAKAIRHAAGEPGAPPPGHAVAAPAARPGPDLRDSAPAKLGETETLEGKPVAFEAVDPAEVVTDAATFQFKSEGDAAGVTARLKGVKRWDPLSAGKSFIFERANGEQVIADGHQRLGLAKRLADQKPRLHAYIFREADGWTPSDVRAHAALKNMRELSGSSLDMAKVMRERPDLVDDSLPLSDGRMREAVMLARLSDEAFDAVAAGRLPLPFAALIGEHVTDPARHAGLLNEIAAADLANATQARFYLAQLMELPTVTETQITLFGEEAITRTLMAERSRVLDGSLKTLKSDKRIFGVLEREAGRIAAAGNVLDRQGNAVRAQNAAELAELIERLATTRGVVASLLNDAAIAVARGLNAAQASRAFVRRIGDILDAEGLNGLLKAPDDAPAPGGRIDDPAGAEAKAQAEALEEAGQETMFAMRAFHGTPHEFDRFDLSRIGTGENAQALGHGLYFAENELTAKDYRDRLGNALGDEGKVNGKKFNGIVRFWTFV